MADKKMNDFATASDGAYIYAESASGEQIKISKADLASVVAGLCNIRCNNVNDLNTLHRQAPEGVSSYSIVSATLNSPFNIGGVLLNVSRYSPKNTYSVIFQLVIPIDKSESIVYRNIYIENGNESVEDWVKL